MQKIVLTHLASEIATSLASELLAQSLIQGAIIGAATGFKGGFTLNLILSGGDLNSGLNLTLLFHYLVFSIKLNKLI